MSASRVPCRCSKPHDGECERVRIDAERVVDKRFAYRKPGDDGLKALQAVREGYSVLARLLQTVCPASRELSVAMTELETSAMWATKSIAVNDPESKVLP